MELKNLVYSDSLATLIQIRLEICIAWETSKWEGKVLRSFVSRDVLEATGTRRLVQASRHSVAALLQKFVRSEVRNVVIPPPRFICLSPTIVGLCHLLTIAPTLTSFCHNIPNRIWYAPKTKFIVPLYVKWKSLNLKFVLINRILRN